MNRESGASEQLTRLRTIPGVYTAYIWKNVNIMFWFGAPSLEHCATLDEGIQRCMAEHPEGVSSINVMVPGGRDLPDAATRAELSRILGEQSTNAAAVGVLIPGSGFWASMLRSVMLAISMVRPQRLRLSVFSAPHELVEWLVPFHCEQTGVQLEAAELMSVFQAAERAALASKAA